MKLILIQIIIFLSNLYFNVSQECPNQCNCNQISNIFNVTCDQSNTLTYQENILNNLNLEIIDIIIVRYLNIRLIPSNLCFFNQLKILDLSKNQISTNITGTTFSCLFELNTLNLSSNLIHFINENAFNFNAKLLNLDLSYNRIEHIPFNLFQYKLENLQNLYLQGNFLKELDIWYFYLKKIEIIDLRFNKINQFKNENNFYIDTEMIYPSLASATLIDLRNNLIEKFDDDILKLYNICNESHFLFFIRLLYTLRIDENPLQCNCTTSFNFINYFLSLTFKNFLNTENNIFKAKCTNLRYKDKVIFNFLDPNEEKDCLIDYAFSQENCPLIKTTLSPTTQTTEQITSAQTSTVGLAIPENLLDEPNKDLKEINLDYFNDSQIAGYIIAFFGLFFLFLIFVYFLCPIEILAICFDCIPYFYKICPCKSGIKREKEFDIFISYNRINKNWVEEKLIPYIKEKNLVFILHYDLENNSNEVFGYEIKERMEKSSCLLFILSDAFLINEWKNRKFREYTKYLVTRKKIRFVAIQMHDICDEEVDEYFTENFEIPNFISLENDEFFFWKKLGYILFTNNKKKSIQPTISIEYTPKPNDDINFDSSKTTIPIIHMPDIHHGNIITKLKGSLSPSKEHPKKKKSTKKVKNKTDERIIEKKYEIARLNNEYFPIDDNKLIDEKKYHKINLEKFYQSGNDEYVDSLILTKEN